MDGYAKTVEANVLAFARELREAGLLIGPQEVALGLKALGSVSLKGAEDAKRALRTVFATTPLEQRIFDRLFERYWTGGLLEGEDVAHSLNLPKPKRLNQFSMVEWEQGEVSDDTLDTLAYSAQAAKASEDEPVQGTDVEELRKLVRRLSKHFATRPSRRWTPSGRRGEMADLRRTIRRSLGRGGELLEISFKRRKLGKMRLVFVFDVSGSMMVYSQLLLQLAYAFVRETSLGRAEVFGFSTELYHLTPHLRRGGVAEAVSAARRAMPGRSGGTRIGEALSSLLEHHGALIDRDSVVIINSDGWDTGDLDRLRSAMRTLNERAERVIWLNPLAGSPGYEPTASGMRTALPYIDTFAPAHNLASLQALESRLGNRRP